MLKKRLICVSICFAAVLGLFPISASADVAGDPAVETSVSYAPKSEEGYFAEQIGGGMFVYSATAQKNTTVYENNNTKKSVGQIKKGDIVVVIQHSEGGFSTNEKWTKILYNNKIAQISRSSLTAPKKQNPTYYIVLRDFVKKYTRAAKSVTVYAKASTKSKKLGTIRAGSNVVLVSEGKNYDTILAGNVKGYVKHGNLKAVDRDKLDETIAKAMGTYLETVDWDYGGLVSKEDRASRQRNSAYGNEMHFFLAAPNYEYQSISEYHFPDAKSADKVEASLMKSKEIELVYSDTVEIQTWNPKYTLHCYRNKNVIIVYCQGDEDAVYALEMLQKTHGEPFKVWN